MKKSSNLMPLRGSHSTTTANSIGRIRTTNNAANRTLRKSVSGNDLPNKLQGSQGQRSRFSCSSQVTPDLADRNTEFLSISDKVYQIGGRKGQNKWRNSTGNDADARGSSFAAARVVKSYDNFIRFQQPSLSETKRSFTGVKSSKPEYLSLGSGDVLVSSPKNNFYSVNSWKESSGRVLPEQSSCYFSRSDQPFNGYGCGSSIIKSGGDAGMSRGFGKTELSLSEQKKLQWAKEREELNGLWSPWGRPIMESKSTNSLYGGTPPTNVISSSYVAKLGLSTQMPESHQERDYYLPPINGATEPPSNNLSSSTTLWPGMGEAYVNNGSNNNSQRSGDMNRQVMSRKGSLPNYSSNGNNNNGLNEDAHRRQMMQLSQRQPRHSFHQETMVNERSLYFNNNGQEWTSPIDPELGGYPTSGYQSDNNNVGYGGRSSNGEGDEPSYSYEGLRPNDRPKEYLTLSEGKSPRVIMHKIYMDPSANDNMRQIRDPSQNDYVVNTMSQSYTSSDRPLTNMGAMNGNMSGSKGYLSGANKPPPVAMRSSLTFGLDSPYANNLKDIERKEKELWLYELEKQREEQRLRKLLEKDDKRARWGDRGVGVGHFWEPSDSSNARLPPPSRDGDRVNLGTSPTPPAWLERSLSRMQSSKSQPNLADSNSPDNMNSEYFLNQSSIDLRNVIGMAQDEEDKNQRTYIRGQNVPVDPKLLDEQEKRRLKNNEHQDALKKQIEERQQKLKDEKERRLQEEQQHEVRMAQQRELELKRLEMEKRKRSGYVAEENANETYAQTESVTSKSEKRTLTNQNSEHEPPLIPHEIVHEPDAYELEIARRQSIMLSSTTDELGGSDSPNGLLMMADGSHSGKSFLRNQCLMTDSDHLYERTLTPTKERSRSLGRNKECGTQTEVSDGRLSSGDKSGDKSRSHNSLGRSRETKKKPDEKPRWGSNPVKKQYLKQSEKDPNYQQRIKRREDRIRQIEDTRGTGLDTGTDESEDFTVPFHRVRSRINKSRSPNKNSRPLRGVHSKTEANKKQAYITVENSSQSVWDQQKLKKNFKSDPSLSKTRGKSFASTIVNQNLGSIGGLNSIGTTSEESVSGVTSPSLEPQNSRGGSLRSGPSPVNHEEYVPAFSNEFISQRDFDERPINAGNIAPGFQKTFHGGRGSPEKVEASAVGEIKGNPARSNQIPKPKVPNHNKPQKQHSKPIADSESATFQEFKPSERPTSPPVPALLKKMQQGFQPDETGRLSSLPTEFPEILSPIPPVQLSFSNLDVPTLSHTSKRLTSAAPKLDIDIAIIGGSNEDLLRIYQEAKLEERQTREISMSQNAKEFGVKLPYLAPEVITGRSSRGSIGSRPVTKDSEWSFKMQEDFIMDLMSQKEVQDQLSARGSELSEKGIIQFNLRMPSRGRSIKEESQNLEGRGDTYRDPLFSDKRRATANWLYSIENPSKESVLTNLSSIKKGVKPKPEQSEEHSSVTDPDG